MISNNKEEKNHSSADVDQLKSLTGNTDIKTYSNESLLKDNELEKNDFNSVPVIYEMGSSKTFWVENLEFANDGIDNDHDRIDFLDGDWNEAMYQITAVVVNITKSAYIFVEQDEQIALEKNFLNKLGSELGEAFEEKIKPIVAQFGEPSDIDNNGKIIILIFPFKDTVSSTIMTGYFFPLNMYDKSPDKNILSYYSNNGEIININSDIFENSESTINDWGSTLIHEYFHLVHYNYIHNEDLWLEEGLAVFTEYLAGLNTGYQSYLRDGSGNGYFNNAFDLSLTYFEKKLENYGQSFLLILYLYEKFGLDFIKSLIRSNIPGIDAISNEMNKINENNCFCKIYNDWIVTNLVNDQSNPDYSYSNFTYRISDNQYTMTNMLSFVPSEINYQILPYWSSEFYKLPVNNLKRYTITFHPELLTINSKFQLSIVTTHADGSWDLEKIHLINGQTQSFSIQYLDRKDTKIIIISSLCGCSSSTGSVDRNVITTKYFNAFNLYLEENSYNLVFELDSITNDFPTYDFIITDMEYNVINESFIRNITIFLYNWNLNKPFVIKNQNITFSSELNKWIIDYTTFQGLEPGQYYFNLLITFTSDQEIYLRGLTFLYKNNPYPNHYFKDTITKSSDKNTNVSYLSISILCLVLVAFIHKKKKFQ